MAITYDERRLIQRLDSMPPVFRSAFAASAATRLLPAFANPDIAPRARPDARLTRILEELWFDLETQHRGENDLQSLLDICMTLLPDESDEWATSRPYAEEAVSCVAYALRSRLTGSSQEAAYAARRAYEALDLYAMKHLAISSFQAADAETRLLAHPRVQAELTNQQQDLNDLVSAQQSKESSVVERLRQRSTGLMYHFLSAPIS